MELFKRWKKDLKFRRVVVLATVLLLLLVNFIPLKKEVNTQSYCDSFNEEKVSLPRCINSGCGFMYYESFFSNVFTLNQLCDIGEDYLLNIKYSGGTGYCVGRDHIGSNDYFIAQDKSTASELCSYMTSLDKSGKTYIAQSYSVNKGDWSLCDQDYTTFKCIGLTQQEIEDNDISVPSACLSWQKPFASIYDSTLGKAMELDDCSSKFYTLVAVVIFMLVAVI
jgi:hypothetical protein